MHGFSSQFLDNQPKNRCTLCGRKRLLHMRINFIFGRNADPFAICFRFQSFIYGCTTTNYHPFSAPHHHSPSQAHTGALALAGGSESRPRQGRALGCPRESTSRNSSHLVPPYDHLPKEKRLPEKNHRFSGTQLARNQGNTPHSVPLPPGSFSSSTHQEDGVQCLEWVSLRGTGPC